MAVPVGPFWCSNCKNVEDPVNLLNEADVPKEVNGWRRYGGPPLRQPLRMFGMKIEGISEMETLMVGYYKAKNMPDGTMILHNTENP